MEIKTLFLTNNPCYQAATPMKPVGIVVHSTGCPNPALRRYLAPDDGVIGRNEYGNHWNQSSCRVGVHAMIGKDKDGGVRCYQLLPWNIAAWGVGSGVKGSYNYSPTGHIQFEICEDLLQDEAYFTAAFSLAAEFCAEMCREFGLPVASVVSHAEAHRLGYGSNHADCDHWLRRFDKNMDWFRAQVTAKMNAAPDTAKPIPAASAKPAAPTKPAPARPDVEYQVYAGGKWYSWVKNRNDRDSGGYAGVEGKPIQAIRARLPAGHIRYRVHTVHGRWYDWVTDYNLVNSNGYAGVPGKDIDEIQMELPACAHHVRYRCSLTGTAAYLPWVTDCSGRGSAGYAGVKNQPMDKLQVEIL